jgi:hypothetical protein
MGTSTGCSNLNARMRRWNTQIIAKCKIGTVQCYAVTIKKNPEELYA